MLAEALRSLTDLVTRSLAPQPLPVEDPNVAVFVVDGRALTYNLPLPPRRHNVWQLADLVALANRFREAECRPAVWYDEGSVVLVIDDDGRRRGRVTFVLEPSDAFARLVEIAKAKQRFDHKPFVRLLRIDLAGALDPAALLNPVRKVRFENGVTVKAEVAKNRESLGRDITSRVDAETELPETVTLNVPVYKNLGERERYPVRCSVEVDPAEGFFRLLPLPDELEATRHAALRSIADRLAAGLTPDVPAYYGCP